MKRAVRFDAIVVVREHRTKTSREHCVKQAISCEDDLIVARKKRKEKKREERR
tara:strand:+ start:180 stop:338 length:159 start_codon:yes stop_codon:yes gene_type:complete